MPDGDGYPSLTFNRAGFLYASNNTNDQLDLLDPCTCQVQVIGDFGYTFIPGISADAEVGLYGIENATDVLLTIDVNDGAGTEVGPFNLDFANGGATWSDDIAGLYAIESTTDKLYIMNKNTGAAMEQADLNLDYGTVGMEWHPEDQKIYSCTNDAKLYEVDPNNGDVTEKGQMGHTASCTNLAAPWTYVQCVDDL
jgi:hypothetical protein